MNQNFRFEWYEIYYTPCHNPVTDAFSLMNQWLVSTPAAILDKANFWKVKAGTWDYNLVPCPETPFNVPYDPFRDWREFPIDWDFGLGRDWHREGRIFK